MNPPKVCIVSLEYPPDQWGGLARTVQNVACHLRDMEMEVHFCPEMVVFSRSGLENADVVAALSHDLLQTASALFPVDIKGHVIFNSVQIPAVRWQPQPRWNLIVHAVKS